MASQPIRLAVIGMGGFAQQHQRAALSLEEQGACKLVATCDPQPENFAADQEKWRIAERNVSVYTDYLEMLERHGRELDVVTVPTPVPLHAAMHRECIDRGLACYLEKPPTLFPPEMDEMCEVETRARRATQVGFNFIVELPRRELKARLLEGEFGALRSVGFVGIWPRPAAYYRRAAWAGKLQLDGRPVLDSPLGNAMAHYVHNTLFWCGEGDVLSWGSLAETDAELYRAHVIESFDTGFVRGRTASGVEVSLVASHACDGQQYQREIVRCERAEITYITNDTYVIRWNDGRREEARADRRDLLRENLRSYFGYVRGEADRPLTRLEDCRPFVDLHSQVFVAAGRIHRVGPNDVRLTPGESGGKVAIKGIEEAAETFVAGGPAPSGQGLSWGQPGGHATAADIPRLSEVIGEMASGA